MISPFISLSFFNTLFIETISSRELYESNKALEIKTSVLFNLVFAHNFILSCFFFFFSIIDLYFLTTAVIAQIFNPTAELAIPPGIPNKEAKAEMETHPVTAESKISRCSI